MFQTQVTVILRGKRFQSIIMILNWYLKKISQMGRIVLTNLHGRIWTSFSLSTISKRVLKLLAWLVVQGNHVGTPQKRVSSISCERHTLQAQMKMVAGCKLRIPSSGLGKECLFFLSFRVGPLYPGNTMNSNPRLQGSYQA